MPIRIVGERSGITAGNMLNPYPYCVYSIYTFQKLCCFRAKCSIGVNVSRNTFTTQEIMLKNV